MAHESEFRRKKKSDLRSGTDVLQALFENGSSPLSVQFIRWKLWKMWPDFVGASISANCEPVGYFRGTLYVWVKSSSWMQQLVFMKGSIRETINKKLDMNYVSDIRFTMDRKSIPQDAAMATELKKSIETLMKETESGD